jgi:hypothetical protein
MAMGNVYWNDFEMSQDGRFPSILAIGDSWFWYPFPGGSLLSHLGPLVETKGHTILAIGNNGAEAVDYTSGKYRKLVNNALNIYGDASLSAVFVSGGGNDFAGFNDLRPLLHGDNSNAQTAEECFLPGAEWPSLGWLVNHVYESLAILIGRILIASPHAIVVLHNYDYAIPDGRGVFGGDGWIKEALVRTSVPIEFHRGCVRHVIDRFSDMQNVLVQSGRGQIVQVDGRGELSENDWANELHPNGDGFRKLAQKRWRPVLRQHNLCS